MPRITESDKIYDLVQPLGGLFNRELRFRAYSDEPRLITRVLQLGNIGQVLDHVQRKGHFRASVNGTGSGLDEAETFIPAIGEGLERYCTCVYAKEQFISATAEELGDDALDLETIPCCSNAELSDPRCSLVAPDKKAPIRWVQGLSLLDGRLVYLPVVMVYLYAGFVSREERIWLPITTGCAGQTSFERALLSAILEVIERDAISITWLQQLPLPRIEIDNVSPELAPYWKCGLRSSKELEYFFFDATTDLGISTIYGLQVSKANKRLTTLVSCSTSMDPGAAVIKVMRDMAACRIAFRQPRPTPEKWEDFTDIFHGASYMARSDQAHAFEFLLDSGRKRFLSEIVTLQSNDEKQALQMVLERFRRRRMDVYAVDLSTDEALRCGVRVVRVIIPGLQPLSFHHRARYLGHSRLYEMPKQMGFPVHREDQLNRWPQPFA